MGYVSGDGHVPSHEKNSDAEVYKHLVCCYGDTEHAARKSVPVAQYQYRAAPIENY